MAKRPKQNSDHAQRHNTPTIDNEAIAYGRATLNANQLKALLTPAIANQQKYYKQLGLRDRILNLSLIVAVVLTLLWRQVPGVQELTRLLAREDLLSHILHLEIWMSKPKLRARVAQIFYV